MPVCVRGRYFPSHQRDPIFIPATFAVTLVGGLLCLQVSDAPPGPPPEQDIPLNIPKKTKLYVEQTQRERDQATEMHRLFQRDLCKLRLNTARAYVKIITDGQGPMSYSSTTALRLNAAVLGLGPGFKLVLLLQNNGTRSLMDLTVSLNYNPMVYFVPCGLFKIPLLLPVSTCEWVCVCVCACVCARAHALSNPPMRTVSV